MTALIPRAARTQRSSNPRNSALPAAQPSPTRGPIGNSGINREAIISGKIASAPSAWTEHADGTFACHAEGRDSMHPSLNLRGERWTPDGTTDVTKPTERDSQQTGCPKGKDPARRAPRQRGGLNRLGLVAAKRLPTSTKDAPLIPDLEAQPRGVRSLALRIGSWRVELRSGNENGGCLWEELNTSGVDLLH